LRRNGAFAIRAEPECGRRAYLVLVAANPVAGYW
jgi:hypothetical protein